jgi:hypothetical protein
MKENTIKQIETKQVKIDNQSVNAIFIAADIYDKAQAKAIITEVKEKFTLQKMISPPNTTYLLITIIGDLSAKEFKSVWNELAEADIILKTTLSLMQKADVIYGTQDGKIIEQLSLL